MYTEYSPPRPTFHSVSLQGHSFSRLRFLVSPILGHNGEIQKFVKNRKLKISKIQNSTFVRTTEKKIPEKVEKIQRRFEGGIVF